MRLKAPTRPTEREEQKVVVKYCALAHIPIVHIANEGNITQK